MSAARHKKGLGAAALFAAVLLLPTMGGRAATLAVAAGGDNLRQAIVAAQAGDVLVLSPGLHRGPIRIDIPLTLRGEAGAIVDGAGEGRTIEVTATNVTIQGLTILRSVRPAIRLWRTTDSGAPWT